MQGSIRKKGATYSYRIDLGMVDGKRKQKEKSGFKTKHEAQLELTEVLHKYNTTGEIFINQKITLQEVFDEFIKNDASATRAYATIIRYKSIYNNHFKTDYGYRLISTINSNEIQDYLYSKLDTLSNEFVRSIYNFLLVMFKYMCKRKYLIKNIMEDVDAPPQDRYGTIIKVYTDNELQAMTERFKTTHQLPAFKVAINTGVRAGECYALRWSDVDFDNNMIDINKQLQYHNKRWCFTPPKTKNSYRAIKIGDNLKNYLLEIKALQEENKKFYGDSYKTNFVILQQTGKSIQVDDFINVKKNGEMLCTNSDKTLSRICKKELNIDFKFHNLRHTHTTKLVAMGVNPKYVQARLGHAKLETTLKYYTHVTEAMHQQVTPVLDEIY